MHSRITTHLSIVTHLRLPIHLVSSCAHWNESRCRCSDDVARVCHSWRAHGDSKIKDVKSKDEALVSQRSFQRLLICVDRSARNRHTSWGYRTCWTLKNKQQTSIASRNLSCYYRIQFKKLCSLALASTIYWYSIFSKNFTCSRISRFEDSSISLTAWIHPKYCSVHFVEIRDRVQFKHSGKETIQQFQEQMNLFQIRQFVIRNVDGNGEEQARISPVNEFVGIVFNEACRGQSAVTSRWTSA
jgi:hypothetical protein